MKSYFKILICVAEEHSTPAAAEAGDPPTASPGAGCQGWLGMGSTEMILRHVLREYGP